MRYTCSSAKTSWTVAFRARALRRSIPNGFSMMMRARSTRLARPRVWTTARAAAGGRLKEGGRGSQLGLGFGHGGGRSCRAAALWHVREPLLEGGQVLA